MAISGRHVDAAAVTLAKHYPQLMLHTEQRAEDVGVEGGRVALPGLLRHRTGLAFGAGVIDGYIQATEAGYGLIDQVAHIIFVPHVGAPIFGLRAEGSEFDMGSRTLVPPRQVVDPAEADELAIANRDLRKMAKDIAAGDVSPSVLRRRIARRSRGASE